MKLTRVFPADAGSTTLDLDDADARNALLDLYRPPAGAWLRLNLIASASGSAGGSDGTSHTLSNPVDRTILGVIRELGDVVVIGAQSLRAEGYLLPRRAPLAVVTASGDLTGHGLADDTAPGRVIVLCPASARETVSRTLGAVPAEVIVVDGDGNVREGALAPGAVIAALRERGMDSIVCEGGPSFARQLLDAGLIDEFCLSTSPLLNGAAIPVLGAGAAEERALTLTQLLIDESSGLYARWAVAPAAPRTATAWE